MKRHLYSAVITSAVVLSSSAAALAQTATGAGSASASTGATASVAAPPYHTTSSERTGVGVGAEVTTTGVLGATVVYDGGTWRGEALFGSNFNHNERDIDLFGRFFFVLHRGTGADFSVGPGIGLVNTTIYGVVPPNGGDQKTTDIHLEGAAQIRAFIVPNVALSGTVGLGIMVRSSPGNDQAVIGAAGNPASGALGITYFFF